MKNNRDIYKDFDVFTRSLIATKDVDPVYPLLKTIFDKSSIGSYNLWFTFCYVGFYNIKSGLEMFRMFSSPEYFNKERFITLKNEGMFKQFGHERRGSIRNVNTQADMFESVAKAIMPLKKIAIDFTDNTSFRRSVEKLPHHGGWAAFKIAEIMEKSFGYTELAINDLGLDGRDPNRDDSPIGGLKWLYGRDNEYDKSWFDLWNRFGSNLAKAYNTDIGVIETCLCKFHKLVSGNYYVGHDIHEFHDLKGSISDSIYHSAIFNNFDTKLFLSNEGVNKQLKSIYSKSGVILNAKYGSELPKVDVLEILMETN